ncbi:MAG: hypothetical protein IH801_03345, partial [Nitrospinae bacterium]|nr:hypothetical protein [Nitrospinota bacterium]
MDVGQLGRELKAGTHRPAYLVSGPDTYLAEEALRALLESLLPPEERELGLIRLYADQVEVEEVLDEARTIPFFGSRRLVVVRQVEAWQGLFSPPRRAASSEEPVEEKSSEETKAGGQLDACRQSLLEYLETPNPTTHLIFVGRKVDGRNRAFFPRIDEADGIGAVALVNWTGVAISAGAIVSGRIYEVRYDATNARFVIAMTTDNVI